MDPSLAMEAPSQRVAIPEPVTKPFEFEPWLMILCSQTGVRKTDIPAEILEMLRKQPSKNEVNKLFFKWHEQFNKPKPLVITDEQKAKFKEIITFRTNPEYINAKRNIDGTLNNIRSNENQIRTYLSQLQNYRATIDRFEGRSGTDVWPMVEAILADGWYQLDLETTMGLQGIMNTNTANAKVHFLTPRIVIKHWNAKAGINQEVDMGTFRVEWYPQQSRIRTLGEQANIEVGNGYIHPHITPDGDVCWGNARDTYAVSMAKLEPVKAFEALRVILQNYNAESPYVGLDRFAKIREADASHGENVKFIIHPRHAWILRSEMPETWATTYLLEELEHDSTSEDGSMENDEGETMYKMQIFRKVYTNNQPIPGEENKYYISMRNGRKYAILEGDIFDWAVN